MERTIRLTVIPSSPRGREERPNAPGPVTPKKRELTDDEYATTVEAGLVGGERVLESLDLRQGMRGDGRVRPDSLVLTDSHLVYLSVSNRERSASMISIRDVTSATVASEKQGPSAYVWGVLALVLAFLLWRVIDDPVGSVAAGIAIAAMGIYLIGDKLFSPITSVVLVYTEDGDPLRCELRGGRANADVHRFISQLFARKEALAMRRAFGPPPAGELALRGRYAARVSLPIEPTDGAHL